MNKVKKLARTGSLLCLTTVVLIACGGGGSSSDNVGLGDSSLMDPIDIDAPISDDGEGGTAMPVIVEPATEGVNIDDSENTNPLDEVAPGAVVLLSGDNVPGIAQVGSIQRFLTNTSTSILLISEQGLGNADLTVFDVDMNEVCVSTATDAVDLCTELVFGETYFIDVIGVADTDYRILSLNSPKLIGDASYSNVVPEEETFVLVGTGFSAVNLQSLTGDADLTIIDMTNNTVCFAENKANFDSCNNVDGSNTQALDREGTYIILVTGFTTAMFELQTLDADELQRDIPFESFVAAGERVNVFVREALATQLTTLSGENEATFFDATTNALVCSPADFDSSNCSTDNMTSLRIELLGLTDSEFTWIAF